ncbi:MAG: hypothetical protein M0R16_10315 [Bacteroidales bacterium]|jgi:hypothetical protein|nr:hypothetical protein [Bacteroidales bacterium]
MFIHSNTKAVCHAGSSILYDSPWLSKTFSYIKHSAWILPVFILLLYGKSYSQTAYRTTNGYVLATGNYNDSVFFAESHKLAIVYDPVNKAIHGSIDLRTLTSGITVLDSIFFAEPQIISLFATIPVDFLTWDHQEYNIDVPLEISANKISVVALSKMKFSHVDRMLSYNCIMEASFKLLLSDFSINIPPAVSPSINVQFLQLILRKGRN